MKILIDTDVLSELQKPLGQAGVKHRLAEMDSENLFVSVISIGEISYGIARLPMGARRRELEVWLEMAERHYADRVLPIEREIAQLWGEITAKAEHSGRKVHAADGLIAATALHHGMRIMTRNVKDYEPTGVMTINPWEG